MRNNIVFTLQVCFARSKYFSYFLDKRSELLSSFMEVSSEIAINMKYLQAKQNVRIRSLVEK